jgi:hypothetical protein
MVIIGDDNTWILCFVLSCGLITRTHSWAHIAVDILSGVSIVFTCCAVEIFLFFVGAQLGNKQIKQHISKALSLK